MTGHKKTTAPVGAGPVAAGSKLDNTMSGGRKYKHRRTAKKHHKKHAKKHHKSHKKHHKKHHKKSHKKHHAKKHHKKHHKKRGGSVVATAALPFGLLALQKFFQTRKGRKDLKKASKSVRKTARKVSRTLRKAL